MSGRGKTRERSAVYHLFAEVSVPLVLSPTFCLCHHVARSDTGRLLLAVSTVLLSLAYYLVHVIDTMDALAAVISQTVEGDLASKQAYYTRG